MKKITLLLFSILSLQTAFAQQIGANFNENIENIDPSLLSKAEVKWVRGFVNIPRYFLTVDKNGKVTGVNNKAIKNFDISPLTNLKGYKIILSLKLDFKFKKIGAPEENSMEETYLLNAIKLFLTEKNLGNKINILVVGNEPMWETPNGDAKKLGAITNKIITLSNDLKISQNWNYEIFTGALNRVSELQKNDIVAEIIKITKENPLVDGIDLHIHTNELIKANDDPAYIRNEAKITKKIICTEFSIVRLFETYSNESLGLWGTQNGYPSDMKLYEWLNLVQQKAIDKNPIKPEILMDYFNSQSWYPKQWFNAFLTSFKKNNVSIATYGLQNTLKDKPKILNAKSPLWILNFVYNGGVLGNDNSGLGNKNPLVYPEFEASKK
ncbi:hypothetical protein SAMN05443543_11511 [Flavobacterium flevense]|uniref:Glycoside hydrolase family 5 domain-containing protein n=1 Tax=Flavobacterium flevense TaxID=983 RepID=A0A4Y4AZK9_9FLAO|nr:hypothetical protein [Flavobacterium flevense]GEC72759.1 hypothetical protein FFL01_22980 [Flavobacterium flevense]SHM16352.1 hypothetical protein SAMN05443543_11511 [Flavobacterium flevense]